MAFPRQPGPSSDGSSKSTSKSPRLFEGVEPAERIGIFFDGRELEAFHGESVAAALLAAGIRSLRWSGAGGGKRGLFCGMGVCFECRVTIEGRANQRACVTPVRAGMAIFTGGEQ